jgi:broad specificity phosphatase PhoE
MLEPTGDETVIDFIRHGEPLGGKRYRGHGVDDPLSELGWRQMWAAVEGFRGWDRVISSPMRRCREFAEAIAQEAGRELHIDPRLREVGFGSWEGRTAEEIKREAPEEFEGFYQDPLRRRPAGAEPLETFLARVTEVFDWIVAEHSGEHLLVVAHAGVIRAAVASVLDAPAERLYRMYIPYAGLTRFRSADGRLLLEHHGSHGLPPG